MEPLIKKDWILLFSMLRRILHDSSNPVDVVCQFGINTKFTAFAAAFTETRDAENRPRMIRPTGISAQKRSPAVAGARVHSAAVVSRAKHIIGNFVVFIHVSARL